MKNQMEILNWKVKDRNVKFIKWAQKEIWNERNSEYGERLLEIIHSEEERDKRIEDKWTVWEIW